MSLDVKEGDPVHKGQLLGYLDLHDKKKKDLDRAQKLHSAGDLPDEKLEEAQIAYNDQCIFSPIEGVVLLQVKYLLKFFQRLIKLFSFPFYLYTV